ncbi:MAG TPA: guanylate kinase [Chitinophagales bacterium]|nr:guanylate kinase [Chitinophagales bacterium]
MLSKFGKHKAIIFTGPSGGGKTTLSQYTLSNFEEVERSISVTTRLPREGEVHGVDYHFLSVDDFKKHIEAGDFVEWEQVYEGLYYGTLLSEVERIWEAEKVVLFVVDVIGANSLKKYFGENSIKIFVKTPTMEILEKRLFSRGTETRENVLNRLKKAFHELKEEVNADAVIINDVLSTTQNEVYQLILSYINR